MLKKNLDILRRRFPQVLQRISVFEGKSSNQLCYDDSSPSPKLLAIKKCGKVPIYGTRAKDRLIKDWFSALRLKGESLYSLSGSGTEVMLGISWRTLPAGFFF